MSQFNCEADYIEACSDLERLRVLRAAYEHVRTLELGVAEIAVIEGAAIPDAIASVDVAIRDLRTQVDQFDHGHEWFHGRAYRVAAE